jgi:hypothetical protein
MTLPQKPKFIYLLIACILIIFVLFYFFRDNKITITKYDVINRPAKTQPDYSSSVIPPNIAPLNFVIQEDGSSYFVKIYSQKGEPIEIFSKTPKIVIPREPWHKLLDSNRGRQLSLDIFVKSQASTSSSKLDNEQWSRYETLTSEIANEDIDSFLVYRKIRPGHVIWREMGIYQRNLNNFDESLILNNGYFKHGCLNCHAFCANHTDKMTIGIRSENFDSSTLLIEKGKVIKIGTKFGYTSWHPSGRLVTFSVNNVRQLFHSSTSEVRDVLDFDSLIAYYLVDSKTVKTTPDLAKKEQLETYPAWSPDGRYLYFCSAPITWPDRTVIPESYDQIKYDLVRVSYDLDNDQWGQLETVLSAKDTGLSILLPRISADGRWLLFCMCNYGCFPVYQPSSDLYMMDLWHGLPAREDTANPVLSKVEGMAVPQYSKLPINSDDSETWHSWSSNSRWIVFSSKKNSGVFTRIYLAYVDEEGKVYKPIVLPQKDPSYYDSCLWTYSVPELVREPVGIVKEKLGRVVRGSQKISVSLPITMATPSAEADHPWRSDRE